MVMKTWVIEVYYGNTNPYYVKKNKIDRWRNILRDTGFVTKEVTQADETVRWVVTHPTNENALEEMMLMQGDILPPAKIREMENV